MAHPTLKMYVGVPTMIMHVTAYTLVNTSLIPRLSDIFKIDVLEEKKTKHDKTYHIMPYNNQLS